MTHIHPFRRIATAALIAVAARRLTPPRTTAAPAGHTAGGAPPPPPEVVDLLPWKHMVYSGPIDIAGRDYAGAWELYTAAGQAAISQADYVKLNEACSRKGLAITLTSARMDGADKAVVIAKQLVATQSYTMAYENNAWKLQPAADGLALYKLGATKAIAAQKKAGTCAHS